MALSILSADRLIARAATLFLSLWVCACTTERTTSPQRTAEEELLISTAADRAAQSLVAQMPASARAYVDASGVSGAPDSPYAIATIEDQLLRHGAQLVTDRNAADTIVLVRIGALSTNETSTLLGVPSINVPLFPVGNLTIPEIALYKHAKRLGIAKFAATAYNAKTGQLITSSDPVFGFAQRADWSVLFIISWSSNNLRVPKDR